MADTHDQRGTAHVHRFGLPEQRPAACAKQVTEPAEQLWPDRPELLDRQTLGLGPGVGFTRQRGRRSDESLIEICLGWRSRFGLRLGLPLRGGFGALLRSLNRLLDRSDDG